MRKKLFFTFTTTLQLPSPIVEISLNRHHTHNLYLSLNYNYEKLRKMPKKNETRLIAIHKIIHTIKSWWFYHHPSIASQPTSQLTTVDSANHLFEMIKLMLSSYLNVRYSNSNSNTSIHIKSRDIKVLRNSSPSVIQL